MVYHWLKGNGVETYDSQARTHKVPFFPFAYCKHCLNKRDIDGLPTQPAFAVLPFTSRLVA